MSLNIEDTPKLCDYFEGHEDIYDYIRHGCIIVKIPINKLFSVRENANRFERLHLSDPLISEFDTLVPITLGDYNNETGKYEIADGNHRYYCCKRLGYKFILAIYTGQHINDKFSQDDIMCTLNTMSDKEIKNKSVLYSNKRMYDLKRLKQK